MLIIGERINASRKYIAHAIASRDTQFIQNEARVQDEAGADYIDVNAGIFVGEEKEKLAWLIEAVQEVTQKPLSLDSPDPAVIQAVLPLTRQTPMINSITLEKTRMEGILPLAREYDTPLIALCQSEDTIAETSEEKLSLASELVRITTSAGIPIERLYIDPLVYPLATNTQSARATLEAIAKIMAEFPGVHTTCGLTNVSHGLPNRKLINRTFLVSAITYGLDSAILDPTDNQLYSALKAALAINGKDDFCIGFITAHREGRLE